MSMNILYCEGVLGGPDVIVLRKILTGISNVNPVGSKYGFGQKILLSREFYSGSIVAGIRDRDFDDDTTLPIGEPREWCVENNTVCLGWYWERKEIENYLIDPVVVQHALGAKAPEEQAYRAALNESAETIADYTAARIALSISRVRFIPLENAWGASGSRQHMFPGDNERQEHYCRQAIRSIVGHHTQKHVIQAQDVLMHFDSILPTCRPGGVRFQNVLTFFAGKDLLYGMESYLTHIGMGSPMVFRERVIRGIEQSADDVWTWLPEWHQLRELAMGNPW